MEIIKCLDELSAISGDWNRLAQRFNTPLVRFEWFQASAAAMLPSETLYVVVVRSGGDVCAIAPLLLKVRNGVSTLSWIGDRFKEPCNFLYEDEISYRRLVSAVSSLGLPLRLNRMYAHESFRQIFESNGRSIFPVVKQTSHSLFVPISGSWNNFEEQLSKSRRKSLRRRRENLLAHGNLEFHVHIPSADNCFEHLMEIFAVESSGWKSHRQTAILLSETKQKFFSEYCHSAAALGFLRLFSLRLDDKAIAVRIAVEYSGRLWGLKIGYDEDYRRYSPGILLTHETLRYAFEQNLDAYEFLGEEELWQRIWPVDRHSYTSYRFYPPSVTGAQAFSGDFYQFSRAKLRRLLRSAWTHKLLSAAWVGASQTPELEGVSRCSRFFTGV